MTGDNSNPVVAVAKDKRRLEGDIFIVNGVKIRVVPVSAALIEEVSRKVKDPDVPMIPREDDPSRFIPNPGDPSYISAMADANSRRSRAAIDAMALFGVELIEGLPDDEGWLNRLRYLVRLGHLNLDGFDLNNDLDKEFLFKRYIAVSGDILEKVSRASGVNPADIEEAEKSFRGST